MALVTSGGLENTPGDASYPFWAMLTMPVPWQ